MKNIIFLLFSISFCLSIASQNDSINVTLEKSEVFKEKKSSVLKTIYKDEQHNLYTVRLLESGKSLLIDVFDKELQKQNSYEHNVAKRHEIAGGFLNNNTLGYIEYFNNKKEKKTEAFLYTSSKDKFDFSKKKIFEVSSDRYPSFFKTLFSSSKIDSDFKGNMSFSKSGKYTVFNIDSSDKKNEHHSIIVFDENYNKLWEKEFELPYDDVNFHLQDVKVSDNGEVFVLGKVFQKKNKKKLIYWEILLKMGI